MGVDSAAANSRAVALAASALLRSVREARADTETAADRLELQARRTIDSPVQGFDAAGEPATEEDVLSEALSQIGIGLTLVSAQSALEKPEGVAQLDASISSLESTAETIESGTGNGAGVHGFDTAPGGVLLPVPDAAIQSLDEMSASAAEVATGLLDKARQPLLLAIPEKLRDPIADHVSAHAGRLLRWGLRAVRRGLDLLLSMVDLTLVEKARDKLDQVLAGLQRGDDVRALMSVAIGAEGLRAALAQAPKPEKDPQERRETVTRLAQLSERFGRLCGVLRQIAAVLAGLAGALALVSVALPHATAVTLAGLSIVLGAVVILGRDYTGATDLPGRVRGVRLLVEEA